MNDPAKQLLIELASKADDQATMSKGLLDALRCVRDDHPMIWDSAMAGPLGPVLCKIWDHFKKHENNPEFSQDDVDK